MKNIAFTVNLVFSFFIMAILVTILPVLYPVCVIRTSYAWGVPPICWGKDGLYGPMRFEAKCLWHAFVDKATLAWIDPVFFRATLGK